MARHNHESLITRLLISSKVGILAVYPKGSGTRQRRVVERDFLGQEMALVVLELEDLVHGANHK